MPRSDSSASNPALSTKSRRTGSCRSFFQSILTADGMWPLSYALVSSSTSTMTTPGSLMWDSTQSAPTRTSERLMLETLLGCGQPSRGRPDSLDEKVHMAAEAEVERRVEERGRQRERGEHRPDHGRHGQVADRADRGEGHAHALREPWRCRRLKLCRWTEPRPDQGSVDDSVRRVPKARQRPDGEHRRLGEQ